MKFALPFLLCVSLLFTPQQAHAENILSTTISAANNAVRLVLNIAKNHQNEINKDRMLPLVSNLQGSAESLAIANQQLNSSINGAFENTKLQKRVPDAFANKVVANAETVNSGNQKLKDALSAIQSYLRSLNLKDGQGKPLDASLENYNAQMEIAGKIEQIDFIRESFASGRDPLTAKSKNEITQKMKKALAEIKSVVSRTHKIFNSLKN